MATSTFVFDASIFYVKCDPARPSSKMDPKNPQWEVQIRTTDPEVNAKWQEIGLPSKFFIPKGKGPADGYFRCNLSKRAFKKDGSPAQSVEVMTGDLRPLDPNTIGNGSTANLRLWPREYTHNEQRKRAWYLMGIQVTVLKPYEGGGNNGFAAAGYSVEQQEAAQEAEEGGGAEPQNNFTAQSVSYEPPKMANAARSPKDF